MEWLLVLAAGVVAWYFAKKKSTPGNGTPPVNPPNPPNPPSPPAGDVVGWACIVHRQFIMGFYTMDLQSKPLKIGQMTNLSLPGEASSFTGTALVERDGAYQLKGRLRHLFSTTNVNWTGMLPRDLHPLDPHPSTGEFERLVVQLDTYGIALEGVGETETISIHYGCPGSIP